ncbi:hypothetical protein SA58113_2266 [Staphylococcus argenteus]|nr:hypothetical protein SA58113_2266 [Staphylococcus argenteus]
MDIVIIQLILVLASLVTSHEMLHMVDMYFKLYSMNIEL